MSGTHIPCTRRFAPSQHALRIQTSALFSMPGARPSVDASAAIDAGLLPCLTQLVARMGAGGDARAVWCPPSIYPGVGRCLADVLQFGPLGQVGALVSAVGRRLRGAAEELGAAAAEGGGAEEGGGERAWWLAVVVRQAMTYTETCLSVLLLRWLKAESAAVALAGPGAGQPTQRLAATAAQLPLRSSFALAELLPAVSVSVRLCGELFASMAEGEGRGGECGGGGSVGAAAEMRQFSGLVELVSCGCRVSVAALDCVVALLAKLCQEAAAGPLGSRDGGAGSSSASGAGGSGDGGAVAGAGDGAPGAAWRQLLLRDVRLIELLGAGMALHGKLSRAAAAGLLPPGWQYRHDDSFLRNRLAGTLRLAALTFPVEFRAAAEGAAGEAGAAGGGAGAGAVDQVHGTGPSARPCMSPITVQAVLELEAAHGVGAPGEGGDEGLEAVLRVLGGWDPAPGEAWELARRCTTMYESDLAEVVAVMCGMPQPEEARAEVAAAATADASGSRPA